MFSSITDSFQYSTKISNWFSQVLNSIKSSNTELLLYRLSCILSISIFPVMRYFIFTRCVSNTLDFWKNIEDSAPFLRVPLSIIDVQRFLGEAPKLSVNLISIYTQDGGFLRTIFLAFSTLVVRLMMVQPLVCWHFYGIFLSLSFLFSRAVSEDLGRASSQPQEIFWEVFSLDSVFIVTWQRRAWISTSPLLSNGLSFIDVFGDN